MPGDEADGRGAVRQGERGSWGAVLPIPARADAWGLMRAAGPSEACGFGQRPSRGSPYRPARFRNRGEAPDPCGGGKRLKPTPAGEIRSRAASPIERHFQTQGQGAIGMHGVAGIMAGGDQRPGHNSNTGV